MSEPRKITASNHRNCSVHRQDDNGNRFVVERHLTRDEAERLVVAYESHKHKQTYWVEEDAK